MLSGVLVINLKNKRFAIFTVLYYVRRGWRWRQRLRASYLFKFGDPQKIDFCNSMCETGQGVSKLRISVTDTGADKQQCPLSESLCFFFFP